ncbi:pilus (MSHA type) biogenesis protein MshL [Rhodocyclus tenuis]|uniref:Pilus (MSHA type) biogenesis protein MshL n=2 Tax=Rhodocyclus TaxID=1064 RepID=A0A6L5JV39_RHOTE|nr:pilus (MSHA type) biogenesis protein MshL [Rhodocyclus gracilis]MQY50682.1 pilus (MSHA type) biogenesis protein MshL [Rhodocyclus gracilis]MRD72685.1 pilus (MSHA type) biogenesis protein MshL [Rhodocyclus gracilis]NJA88212.1 pilus (MSHA type) biogenesis protein MshL [Rhodocyclus gracilis]
MKLQSNALHVLTLLVPLTALVVSGCATPLKAPSATFDRIGGELSSASASKARGGDDAVAQAMLPPLQLDAPTAAPVEPRFDLAVSNAPAAQVFMALVSGTRYSMLVAPDVSGTITVNLKNVTLREALETIREMYGYEFKTQGTRIYIQSNAIQTRIFQVNYLAGKRQGQSDVRVTSSSISNGSTTGNNNTSTPTPVAQPTTTGTTPTTTSGGMVQSSRILTTQDSDFWRDLTQALNAIVGNADGRNVIVSPASGVILVKAMPAELREVENYLRATQMIVERQVMLEAKIIEVSLSEAFQSGVNWSAFGGRDNRYGLGMVGAGASLSTTGAITGPVGVSVTPGVAGAASATALGQGFFGLALQTNNFAALLNFLESQGGVQVLSSPRIATINNQKAVLKVGTDQLYVTNVSTTTTSVGTSTVSSPSITLQPFFSGIALDVTPQIDDNNNIILHVHPSVSVVAEQQKTINLGTLGNFTLPLATSAINETDSIVRVQDGNIVAIGGLMKQDQSSDRSGLPGASGLPGVGLLFGQRSSSLTKRELVILIKPTLIQNESSWKDDLSETQNRLQELDPRQLRPR